MSDTITIGSGHRRRSFRDLGELREHVDELIATRGGVFIPVELEAVQTLVALSNGDAPAGAASIARATAMFEPERPPRGPSPFDDRVAVAVEALAAEDEKLPEALARMVAVREAAEAEMGRALARDNRTSNMDVGALSDRLNAQVRAADDAYLLARDSRERAKARLTALEMARDRWHRMENLQLHDNG